MFVLLQVHSHSPENPTEEIKHHQEEPRFSFFGLRENLWKNSWYSAGCVTRLNFDPEASHMPKEDGAEQEDGVEEQQAETQTAIQPPVVQMDTRHRQKHRGQQQDNRIHQTFVVY